MNSRTSLTKSLHTVTVVARVAIHHIECGNFNGSPDQTVLAVRLALKTLGQPSDWPDTDPTFAACVAKVKALRGSK